MRKCLAVQVRSIGLVANWSGHAVSRFAAAEEREPYWPRGAPEGGGIKFITTDVLVSDTLEALQAGHNEICVGQAKQLRFMSRAAPGFINKQLFNGSKELIPAPETK